MVSNSEYPSHDAEYVGLSLSYGLSLNSVLFWAIWISCFIENKMVSVERIKQVTNIPSEAAWRIKDCLPDANWPTKGDIDVVDLKVRPKTDTLIHYIYIFLKKSMWCSSQEFEKYEVTRVCLSASAV